MEDCELRYGVLGSGSSANAYFIESKQGAVLVDNGFTPNELLERCQLANFNIYKLRYLFLTHDHSDHSKGVATLANQLNIPVIMHRKAQIKNAQSSFKRWNIESNRCYSDYNFELSFTAFSTSHDSPYSHGYFIELQGFRFTFITDTGVVFSSMHELADVSDVLFLESNYSPTMLANGGYPAFLKERVGGKRGHLSNFDAANFVRSLSYKAHRRIYLCHLSQNNNSVEQLKSEFEQIMPLNSSIVICPRDTLMPPCNLRYYNGVLVA
jgi:phosphoribosyl 1,2-cyclic phosphodiesterase